MSIKPLACVPVCHPGMPDDFGDRHVPHRVPKGISARAAASWPLLCLFLPWPSPCHRGQNSLRLPHGAKWCGSFLCLTKWCKIEIMSVNLPGNPVPNILTMCSQFPCLSRGACIFFSSLTIMCAAGTTFFFFQSVSPLELGGYTVSY